METATPDATVKPLLYIILGAAGSGRREVMADLLEGGLGEEARPAVLLHANERSGEGGDVAEWKMVNEGTIEAKVPEGTTHVFFLTDGRGNPVDQLEALKPWAAAAGLEVARVITVVNCQLAERHPELLAWYDACIHFSDIVLLGHREGVANKWMSDFQARYRSRFYPCLFEMIKQGKVRNPGLILEPEARRMSHVFDEDEWAGISLEGVEFGGSGLDGEDDGDAFEDDDSKERGKGDSDDDDGMDLPEVDPYFERQNGGRRVKQIPDIAKLLG